MIFLDANAFYSYYGRTKLGMTSTPVDEFKLRKYISTKECVSLPTSVYIEIITHFRDNTNILIDIIQFIVTNNIKLYNNIPCYIIEPNEMHCVQFMNEADIAKYANQLLNKKINIESEFTVCFFEITSLLYAKYRIDFTNGLSDIEKDSIFTSIGAKNLKEYANTLKGIIKQELADGYAGHTEQKSLKEIYIKELEQTCLFIELIISSAIAINKNESDLIDVLKQTYAKRESFSTNTNNSTMASIVDAFLNDQTFLGYAKDRISKMFSKHGYSKSQIAYLKDVMFSAWFERGQKLQKNDIFDMFCFGCFDFVDKTKEKNILVDYSPYILCFDDRMKNYIRVLSPNNLKIIENLQS